MVRSSQPWEGRKICRKSTPDRGNGPCEGPEAGPCLVSCRNSEEALWLEKS